jgi:hypothetical protein
MRGIVVAWCVMILVAGCAEGSPTPNGERPRANFDDLTRRPEAFDGRRVEVKAAYYGAFEDSVLTSGFAESYPPQPVEPTIWVAASPPHACLQQAQGATWADAVRASGTFRYDPESGFGHLGAYEMTIEAVSLACA